jgi:hypothetical protein
MKEQWREMVLIVFVIALSIFLFTKNVKTISESIIITEICPSGCASSDHQWIEIYNKSTEPIDLNGWKFWEGGVNHGLIVSPSSTVTTTILLPGTYAIITQNDAVFFADYPDTTSTVFDSAWTTLAKTGEEIGIKKGGGSDDFVELFVYAGVDNHSLERIDPDGDPTSMLEWKEHPDSSTPGRQNYWWSDLDEGEENRIPFARFSAPTSTVVNQSVVFDATGSSDNEGFITRYVWMIEGVEYEGVGVEYVFTTTGTKHVSLTVYDTRQASSTVSRDIEVFAEEPLEEIPVFDARIVINEFLSDPNVGEEEWIELYNIEDEDVVIDGYVLYDGVGKIATVTGTIHSLDFRVVYLTSSKLNQSGDQIILMDPTGDVVDTVSYGAWDDGVVGDNAMSPGKGHATARNSDGDDSGVDLDDFSYTITPTPDFPNNITPKELPASSSSGGSSGPYVSYELPVATFSEGSVVINEFVSSPGAGEEEFVELFNTSGENIVLDDWNIQDGSLAKTMLTGIISPRGFFVIEKPKGSLNNTGDLIVLADPSGTEIDRVVYGEWNGEDDTAPLSSKGESVARVVDGKDTGKSSFDFSLTTTITPGTTNRITSESLEPTFPSSTSVGFVGNFVTGTIFLNEIFPNPDGADEEKEFIELYHAGSTTIDLGGWKIGDASKKNVIADLTIGPSSYAVLYRPATGISLNNSGTETVQLWLPDDRLVDSISYTRMVLSDESFSRFGDEWFWVSSSTPGIENKKSSEQKSVASTTTSSLESVENGSFDFSDTPPVIVEILPNPAGADTQNEYIELYNPHDFDISLAGLFLDDAEGGSKPFAFPLDTTLRSHEYRAWYSKETKLSLTNTSDSVRVLTSDDVVLQEVEYVGAKEQKSYTFGNNLWFWTGELTPNGENPLTPALDTKETSKAKITSTKSAITTTLAQVRNFDVGTMTRLEGVVLVPPGVLSTQYLYVGDERGIGIQVYSYKKEFPPVAVGDTVSLTGELSEVSGEMRLKLASAADITITSSSAVSILPERLEAVDVGESYEGGFIEVVGEVTGIKGSYVYLDDGTDEVKVYIRGGSGIDKSIFSEGARAVVAGIAQETKSGYHLSPRGESDVRVEGVVKGEKILATLPESDSRDDMVRAVLLFFVGIVLLWGVKLYGKKILALFPKKNI